MNILLLAPQPFFIERGTPIAVKLLVQSLCSSGHQVDLLTFHEGSDIQLDGLRIYRTMRLPFVTDIPIGLSWKKLLCDTLLGFKAIWMNLRRRYDVIHAVEESVFVGCVIRLLRPKVRLVYDMDSSMADQLVEKWPRLVNVAKVFHAFEGFAVRRSDLVLPVCQALADKVTEYAPGKLVTVLQDVALEGDEEAADVDDIRNVTAAGSVIALYVGNLEHYQGLDLALEGFAQLEPDGRLSMVIIGGSADDISIYKDKAEHLGIAAHTHFLGPKPVAQLMQYLVQADMLLSPRVKGQNTPMKIYSYLASGKPILATDIQSHTQVLDQSRSLLVRTESLDFANGLRQLLEEPELRRRLGKAGAERARKHHTYEAFHAKLEGAYDQLDELKTKS